MSGDMSQLGAEGEIANRFRLISRMADDLAHEIKNPLNSMVINLEVIRSRARKGDAAGVLDRADVIENEVRRLNELIDGLLKLLRPERTTSDEISVDAVLAELGNLVGLQAKLARKELAVSPIGESAVAHGRRDAIRFALLNILSAELDAIGSDTGAIEVGGDLQSDEVVVRIASRSPVTPASAAEEAREQSLATARILLAGEGGKVETSDIDTGRTDGGTDRLITIRLPRAVNA
ncbi:MAG: histidine kinase dimerization/phospho-acceptor domain-containing protein [Longimicrobiales bacterium]